VAPADMGAPDSWQMTPTAAFNEDLRRPLACACCGFLVSIFKQCCTSPWAGKRSRACLGDERRALGEEEELRAGEGDERRRLLRGDAEDSWEVSGGCDT
jgi:hypothetical protein